MTRQRYDVIVVGAGPAGASAALAAAQFGARVAIIEQRREVGVPVQCAEYVPWQLAQHVPWSESFVAQEIQIMRTHLPNGEVVETHAQGFVLNRALFDKALAAAACQAGAELFLRTRAVGQSERGVLVQKGGGRLELEAAILIGADGPRSTVAGWIGQGSCEVVVARQCRVVLDAATPATEVYFDAHYPGGYGWLFPKGATANVGVGVGAGFGVDPGAALEHLLDRLGTRRSAILGTTGGLIPVGGPFAATRRGNVLLVGDAAGQTHPITGAGIANACRCGEMAGLAAARAVAAGDISLLDEYEREWRGLVGSALAHAVRKRKWLEANWCDDPGLLSDRIRSSWVAFPAYGRPPSHPATGEGALSTGHEGEQKSGES